MMCSLVLDAIRFILSGGKKKKIILLFFKMFLFQELCAYFQISFWEGKPGIKQVELDFLELVMGKWSSAMKKGWDNILYCNLLKYTELVSKKNLSEDQVFALKLRKNIALGSR